MKPRDPTRAVVPPSPPPDGADATHGQARLEDYFARWRAAFEQASLRPDHRVHRLAENQISLRFAEGSLVPILTPALGHLPPGLPHQSPDLEVLCWNAAATAVHPPEPPWRWPAHWRQSAIFHPFDHRLYQVSVLSESGDFAVLRVDTGQALLCIRDARTLAVQHYGSPLLVLLASWLGSRGLTLVHAGCVGTERGAVLLVGKGGSGKSTTCLLGAEAGLDYLADDYCLVGATPVPTAHSLYSSGKLHRSMLASFPRLAALAVDPFPHDPASKPVIFLRKEGGYAVTHRRPLRAIVVPVVTGEPDTTFAPTSAAQALLALAPSTIFQLPNTGGGSFQFLAQLVKTLPCYRLNLGTRFETVPPAIRALLAGLT